jgi:hypothetical protein
LDGFLRLFWTWQAAAGVRKVGPDFVDGLAVVPNQGRLRRIVTECLILGNGLETQCGAGAVDLSGPVLRVKLVGILR